MATEPSPGTAPENASEMLARLGVDGDAWVKEFVKHYPSLDVDAMRLWFCNAIMAGFDEGARRADSKDAAAYALKGEL